MGAINPNEDSNTNTKSNTVTENTENTENIDEEIIAYPSHTHTVDIEGRRRINTQTNNCEDVSHMNDWSHSVWKQIGGMPHLLQSSCFGSYDNIRDETQNNDKDNIPYDTTMNSTLFDEQLKMAKKMHISMTLETKRLNDQSLEHTQTNPISDDCCPMIQNKYKEEEEEEEENDIHELEKEIDYVNEQTKLVASESIKVKYLEDTWPRYPTMGETLNVQSIENEMKKKSKRIIHKILKCKDDENNLKFSLIQDAIGVQDKNISIYDTDIGLRVLHGLLSKDLIGPSFYNAQRSILLSIREFLKMFTDPEAWISTFWYHEKPNGGKFRKNETTQTQNERWICVVAQNCSVYNNRDIIESIQFGYCIFKRNSTKDLFKKKTHRATALRRFRNIPFTYPGITIPEPDSSPSQKDMQTIKRKIRNIIPKYPYNNIKKDNKNE